MDKSENSSKTIDCNNNIASNNQYLLELLEERTLLQNSQLPLNKTLSILDQEITRIKGSVIVPGANSYKHESDVIDESKQNDTNKKGNIITKQDKIFLPVDDHPNFNFVGRILGPRGLTIKQFEKNLDCRIMIRGKGSTRNPKQEEANKGQPNFEHLNENLHVLVVVSDDEFKVDQRLVQIRDELTKFINEPLSIPESQDTVKQMQLMELSILNESERQQRQHAILQQQIVAASSLPTQYPFLLPQHQNPVTSLDSSILTALPSNDPVTLAALTQGHHNSLFQIQPPQNAGGVMDLFKMAQQHQSEFQQQNPVSIGQDNAGHTTIGQYIRYDHMIGAPDTGASGSSGICASVSASGNTIGHPVNYVTEI